AAAPPAAAPDVPPAAPASDAPYARANVLLITLDSVREDRLGCYGCERPTTPHLDELAARSVLFEEAFANSSFTPPTHASLLTGLYPAEHGLRHWNKSLADVPTAADAFAAAGYRTLAITPLKTLLVLGLSRGFELMHSPESGQVGQQVIIADGDAVNASALEALLRKRDDRPFFAWVHYYDAHRPYGRQGPEWSGRFVQPDRPEVGATEAWYQLTPGKRVSLSAGPAAIQIMKDHYDGGLAYLDDRLGQLFSRLQQAGVLDSTIVVVVADHGEVFDEHGPEWFAHDPYLFDENVHIPLLVHLPGDAQAGRHASDMVSQVDVLPTLLELTGVAPLPGQRFSGASFAPALTGTNLHRTSVFADTQGSDLSVQPQGAPPPSDADVKASRDRQLMLRTEHQKLLLYIDRGTEGLDMLLDLADGEQQDHAADQPEALRGALRAYEQWWQNLKPSADTGNVTDAEMQRILKAMGYIR
ncbi:MAG TPA: sulfatase-like hydrolase/transferase, partial [Planctomycetota bacterium]|nr:sulfatase-like hydrolase/transferase [Planctomycetota bacterium]